MNMKKTILVAAGALALASAAAYAQMHQTPGQPGQGMTMHGPMHGPMHEQMMQKMHEHMQKKMQQMHGQAGHGGQQGGHAGGHGGHDAAAGPKGDRGPSSLAFHGINQKMHEGMNITFTGNADVDFVTGMIPHHQGAVDMARVVLAFGRDPEIRKLAEAVIKAQEAEIAFMQEWLKRNAR